MTTLFWFRQDLRLSDNPGLSAAISQGKVLPIYILDENEAGEFKMGAATRCWLHHSLLELNQSLEKKLNIYQGDSEDIILELIKRHQITAVYWNRCYEPWRIKTDTQIKTTLKKLGIDCQSFKASLLWEPWEVLKSDQTPYKVFTPYYRNGCLKTLAPAFPLAKPENMDLVKASSTTIADLNLLPKINWDKGMLASWQIGELAAQEKLQDFLDAKLAGYQEGRNFPIKDHTSRLSPHLHFGEISPRQVWHAAQAQATYLEKDLDNFLSELGWREFSYYLLYHIPSLPRENIQAKFNYFPWSNNKKHLEAWKKGQTGIPIVDAGMRELWQTGYMHNRVRMIVGSFLVKNLLLHWHEGEDWFWDCLVDADLANNSASWQWIAGCGADAAPYFRIFNPVTQGEKFDAQGEYTRMYVPELKNLPDKYLFKPWEVPEAILVKAGVHLGKNYPHPIVDLSVSRTRALEAFAGLPKGKLEG